MFNIGIVRNINDPLKSGRVKVNIIGIYNNITDEDLPWAYVLRTNEFSINENVGLSNHNLVVGQQVIVAFLDNNFQQPLVIGTIPSTDDISTNTSLTKHTLKTSSGHIITIDDTDGSETISIVDKNSNQVIMKDTSITVKATTVKIDCTDGEVTGNLKVDKNLIVGGNSTISGTENVTGAIVTTATLTAVDCIAGAVTLLTHKHGLVTPGNGTSGPAQ